MRAIAGELPHEPGVDGAERELAALGARARAGNVVEQPGELGAAEVRVDDEAGALAHQALGARRAQLLAERRRAPVLPDDRAMQRLAALAIPEKRGLALVRDAHGRELLERQVRFAHRFARRIALRAVDLARVVLDPAGLRIVLGEFALRARHGAAFFVEDDSARAGGALVEREDVAHAKSLARADA